MAKYSAIILFLLLLLSTGTVYGGPLDRPAASVNLIRAELITRGQLHQRMQEIEAIRLQAGIGGTRQNQQQVLETMIGEILVKQGAERARITVSQNEINNLVAQQKAEIEQQLRAMGQLGANDRLTDTQFRELIRQEAGVAYDEFISQLRTQIMQQRYIAQAKQAIFQAVGDPTDREIRDQYNLHQNQFTNPRMVRFSHVFFATLNQPAENRESVRQRANEAYRKLRQGESFDNLVLNYSDDTNSKYQGGDFGYVRIDDRRSMAYFGDSFFNKLFSLEQGDISDVLESNLGFHIVRVTEKRPPVFLELDDPLSPVNPMTVREYIRLGIEQQKASQAFQRAFLELVEDLKKEADITRFPLE